MKTKRQNIAQTYCKGSTSSGASEGANVQRTTYNVQRTTSIVHCTFTLYTLYHLLSNLSWNSTVLT